MSDQLIFESPSDAAGFTQVPNAVLFDTRLSPPAVRLYAVLLHYARQDGECFPGQERLARDMGVSDRQVRRLLDELEAQCLVEVSRPVRRATNLYAILDLGRRDERLSSGHPRPVDRTNTSAPDRTNTSALKKKQVKETQPLEVCGARDERPKFRGKATRGEWWDRTLLVLEKFNACAGTDLDPVTSGGQMSENAKRIYGAIEAWPDVSVQRWGEVVDVTLESRWWGGDRPSQTGLVFGPKVLEQNMRRKRGERSEKSLRAERDEAKRLRTLDDLAAINRLVNGEAAAA